MTHSLLSKIGDDSDSEADDGEYGPNVGHPSESLSSWSRHCGGRADVLKEVKLHKCSTFTLLDKHLLYASGNKKCTRSSPHAF